MAKHTVEQKNILDNIKGQLLGGTIGALILLLIWVNTFNNDPPDPRDLTSWSIFALFAILPVSLLLLLAPLHARGIKSLTLPDEERARFVIFVQSYIHLSRVLFFSVCFAALPAVILRWIDAPLGSFLAPIIALLCGMATILELRASYRAMEAYYSLLPPDLLQEEIEKAKERQTVGTLLTTIMSILLFLQLSYEYWSDYIQKDTDVWQTWGMAAIFFLVVLVISTPLLFMLLERRWVKRVSEN